MDLDLHEFLISLALFSAGFVTLLASLIVRHLRRAADIAARARNGAAIQAAKERRMLEAMELHDEEKRRAQEPEGPAPDAEEPAEPEEEPEEEPEVEERLDVDAPAPRFLRLDIPHTDSGDVRLELETNDLWSAQAVEFAVQTEREFFSFVRGTASGRQWFVEALGQQFGRVRAVLIPNLPNVTRIRLKVAGCSIVDVSPAMLALVQRMRA